MRKDRDAQYAADCLAALAAWQDALRELFLVVSIAIVRGTLPDMRELWQRLVDAKAAVDALLLDGEEGAGD